jgi:hypothetical protein
LEIRLSRQGDSEIREAQLVPVDGDWADRLASMTEPPA